MEQPQGNYYDKYASANIIESKMMDNFFKKLAECLDGISFHKVIECGMGEGNVAHYVKQRYHCEICGGDIGEDVVEIAKQKYPDIPARVMSIYDTQEKEGAYDLVLCCEVMEHLDEYRKGLEELLRISGRYVLISVPREPLWRFLNMCRFKYIKDWGNTPGHVNHWSKRSLLKLLSQYGTVVQVKSPLPWTMVLLEKQLGSD